jgi:hypothetical protein
MRDAAGFGNHGDVPCGVCLPPYWDKINTIRHHSCEEGSQPPLPLDGEWFGWEWAQRCSPHPHLPPRWGEGDLKWLYLPSQPPRGEGAQAP